VVNELLAWQTVRIILSPVAADGRLYFVSEDGNTYVVRAGSTFEILATNPINEVCMATPAISEGMLFVRAKNHVYGIKEQASPDTLLTGRSSGGSDEVP